MKGSGLVRPDPSFVSALPIFPVRLQTSIFGAGELNFRVREAVRQSSCRRKASTSSLLGRASSLLPLPEAAVLFQSAPGWPAGSPGPSQALAISFTPASHGSLIPILSAAQRRALVPPQLSAEAASRSAGCFSICFHTCVLLVIFWVDYITTIPLLRDKLSPYVTEKNATQTKRYQQEDFITIKRRLIWHRPHMDCPSF